MSNMEIDRVLAQIRSMLAAPRRGGVGGIGGAGAAGAARVPASTTASPSC